MHELAVMGASYRTAGMDGLGRMLLPKEQMLQHLPVLREKLGVVELVYLGTCNRLELMVCTERGANLPALRQRAFGALAGREPDPGEAEKLLHLWQGESAVEHLLMVACGLDSARVGDREIATQLRDAWSVARTASVCGARLDAQVAGALAAAREARWREAGRPAGLGLAERGVRHLLAHFGARRDPVALVGVSPMTRSAGRSLARAGVPLVVVNRSREARALLAAELGAREMALEDFWEAPPALGGLVTAVGTTDTLAGSEALTRITRAAVPHEVMLVDLGVPANIDAELAVGAGICYVGMEQIVGEAASERSEALMQRADLRDVVDRHLDLALRAEARRIAGPLIGRLQARFAARVDAELDDLIARDLASLTPEQRAALRDWSAQLARHLAHVPMRGLRGLASSGDLQGVETAVAAMIEALDKGRTQ
jgi:glutamyl-tRNA reductase